MSLEQDTPGEVPTWDYSEDVLGNFEHFADTATGAQALGDPADASFASILAQEPAGPSNLQPDPGDPSGSGRVPSQRGGSTENRKQAQNRQAQQRFRQRQRVSQLMGSILLELTLHGRCRANRDVVLRLEHLRLHKMNAGENGNA